MSLFISYLKMDDTVFLSWPILRPVPDIAYGNLSITGLHDSHFGASFENSTDGPKSLLEMETKITSPFPTVILVHQLKMEM